MAYRVTWSSEASSDLIEAAAPIAATSDRYVRAFLRRVLTEASDLAAFPLQGHVYEDVGHPAIREIPVRGHRLVYQIEAETIRILAFFHGSRQPPDVAARMAEPTE